MFQNNIKGMKRNFVIAAFIGILVGVVALQPACSDDDDPQPQMESLATSYVMPTSMTATDVNSYPEDKRNSLVICLSFQGPIITFDSNPVEFAKLNRFFGDTACTHNAMAFWPKEKHNFVGKPVIDIKAIAKDESWGEKYPEGSDVSRLLIVNFLSANGYIKSNYSDPQCRKEIKCGLAEWKSQWGYSIYNNIGFWLPHTQGEPKTNGIHDDRNCKGHKCSLIITFPDGQMEKSGCYFYCSEHLSL